MENNAILEANDVITGNDVLKLSALVYLKEALDGQKYESCAELVNLAGKFGATKAEITEVISGYLRGDKPGGSNPQKGKNRVRPLTEKK
jgi:hypothetical protein